MDCLIISGMSGAGKSLAVDVLEDIGFYCIDNMPVQLIPHFAELSADASSKYKNVAFVVDVRNGGYAGILDARKKMNDAHIPCRLLFLDCSDEKLINRHKAARRRHPLDRDGDIAGAIAKERAVMEPIRINSDYTIDTTALSTATFKSHLLDLFGEEKKGDAMIISVESFGFKYGIPHEADTVFDVRFVANPFYVPELREKTGLDREVCDYVFSDEASTEFSKKVTELMDFLIPRYLKEGKTSFVIAVGCTGGKHRSVALAEKLKADLTERGRKVVIHHRDILKG